MIVWGNYCGPHPTADGPPVATAPTQVGEIRRARPRRPVRRRQVDIGDVGETRSARPATAPPRGRLLVLRGREGGGDDHRRPAGPGRPARAPRASDHCRLRAPPARELASCSRDPVEGSRRGSSQVGGRGTPDPRRRSQSPVPRRRVDGTIAAIRSGTVAGDVPGLAGAAAPPDDRAVVGLDGRHDGVSPVGQRDRAAVGMTGSSPGSVRR